MENKKHLDTLQAEDRMDSKCVCCGNQIAVNCNMPCPHCGFTDD